MILICSFLKDLFLKKEINKMSGRIVDSVKENCMFGYGANLKEGRDSEEGISALFVRPRACQNQLWVQSSLYIVQGF